MCVFMLHLFRNFRLYKQFDWSHWKITSEYISFQVLEKYITFSFDEIYHFGPYGYSWFFWSRPLVQVQRNMDTKKKKKIKSVRAETRSFRRAQLNCFVFLSKYFYIQELSWLNKQQKYFLMIGPCEICITFPIKIRLVTSR